MIACAQCRCRRPKRPLQNLDKGLANVHSYRIYCRCIEGSDLGETGGHGLATAIDPVGGAHVSAPEMSRSISEPKLIGRARKVVDAMHLLRRTFVVIACLSAAGV